MKNGTMKKMNGYSPNEQMLIGKLRERTGKEAGSPAELAARHYYQRRTGGHRDDYRYDVLPGSSAERGI